MEVVLPWVEVVLLMVEVVQKAVEDRQQVVEEVPGSPWSDFVWVYIWIGSRFPSLQSFHETRSADHGKRTDALPQRDGS